MVKRIGVDLTACWRPRVGMVTLSLGLARALLGARGRRLTLFGSRDRPAGFEVAEADFLLSPYRHELANKLAWLPKVEARAGLEVMLYPYWPSPPRRQRGAPPAAVFVHDLAFRTRPAEVPWQQRAYLGSLLPTALREAGAVLVPSRTTLGDLLEHYPLAGLADRVHVVPEGPLDPVEPGPLPAGLAPGGFILAVGTVEPRKNYRRLLSAHRRLRRGGSTPPLVIAGRTGWGARELVAELEADPHVRLLGHVPDTTLQALYGGALILAFPSLYEGFGLPLLEAMRAGLPALAAAAGALPELAGGAAVLVDPLDVDGIAAGLSQLLADPGLRERLARQGRERAAGYSWEAASRKTLAVLDRLA